MKRSTAIAAALFAATLSATTAQAIDRVGISAQKAANFGTEQGSSLPPIGYIKFCLTSARDCQPGEGASAPSREAFELSTDSWRTLFRINSFVNNKIQPVSDQDQFGEIERWAIPNDRGDCEDYVLLKQRYLKSLGFPTSALLITVVLDEKGEGHAVLTVATSDGDFVLDNRRDDILRWRDTGYTFLKRQSRMNPRQWVALLKQQVMPSGVVSASPAE